MNYPIFGTPSNRRLPGPRNTRPLARTLILASLALAMISLPLPASAAPGPWITTWACGQQLTEPHNLPPVPLAGHTLREFVHTSLGGKCLRVRFANYYGTNSVNIIGAHLALSAGTGSAGDGDINPATDRALTFRGAPGLVIPPGAMAYSDPLEYDLPPLANVAISIFYGDMSATTISGHPSSRTTSFISTTNAVSDAHLVAATKTVHWYTVAGIEVQAAHPARTLVVLGDSITDGRGSTTDGNDRWPDNLARRFATNLPTADVAVANVGIGGNGIFGGLGPAAMDRFDRDVLGQSGVRYLMVFEGVNDIGSQRSSLSTATNLVVAYTQFANQAHAQHIRAYGVTITPFGGSGYFSELHEAERQYVNAWLRTNTVFDGLVDFDAAVRDPANPAKLLPAYNSDNLHLNAAGYHALADAIDLNLFSPETNP